MRLNKLLPIFLGTAFAVFLSACGGVGGSGVRITEGNKQIGTAPTGTIVAEDAATLVHVDMFERIVTIRKGRKLPNGFLISTDSNSGTQTAVLKAQPKRPIGLRTADILEGEPAINDIVTAASPEESARLAKIYHDAESDTE